MRKILIISSLLLGLQSFAQDSISVFQANPEDTVEYERFLEIVENSLFEYYSETWGKE